MTSVREPILKPVAIADLRPTLSPESWNLDQVTEEIRKGTGNPSQ